MGIIRHFAETPPHLFLIMCSLIRSNGAHIHAVLVFLLGRRQRKVHGGDRSLPLQSVMRSASRVHPLLLDAGEGRFAPALHFKLDEPKRIRE